MAAIFSLVWLGIVLYLRRKKRASLVYVLFFTAFYVYLFKVLDYTLFQYQTLLLLQYVMPGLMLQGYAAGEALNLIPLATLGTGDVQTSFLNILLFVPFGFGLPFVATVRFARVILAGALVSVIIESLQLSTGLMAGITFRVADINDVLFNTAGTAMGYALFIGFMHVFRRVTSGRKRLEHPILRYIAERP